MIGFHFLITIDHSQKHFVLLDTGLNAPGLHLVLVSGDSAPKLVIQPT
jgi:hypothetical protein